MDVIGPLINEALAPLVGILKIVGKLFGAYLAPFIKVLGKVFEFVAKLFAKFYNFLVPVFNGLIWVFTQLANVTIWAVNGIIEAYNFLLGWLLGEIDTLNEIEAESFYVCEVDLDEIVEEGGSNTSNSTSYSSGGTKNITQNYHFTYDGAVFTDDEQSAKVFIDWVIKKITERENTTVTT
jgi:hypothetical protein